MNGGAQIRPETNENGEELLSAVEKLYFSIPDRLPEANPSLNKVYDWLGGPESDKCMSLLRTSYHAVEKMSNALAIKW